MSAHSGSGGRKLWAAARPSRRKVIYLSGRGSYFGRLLEPVRLQRVGFGNMSTMSQQYRMRAEECEERANEAPPALRAEFLEIAAQWRELATDVDTIAGIRQRMKD